MRAIANLIWWSVLLLALVIVMTACTEKEEPRDGPEITVESIVAHLEPLHELSALKAHVSGVVSAEMEGAWAWQGTSRMVLLVRGCALYGVDLSEAEIVTDESRIAITLPQPRLTEAWVDTTQTQVWERSSGRLRASDSSDLDKAAWKAAQQLVRDGAANDRHLSAARAQAEAVVTDLVRALAPHATIEVVWARA